MPESLDDPYFMICEPRLAWLTERRNGWQFGEQGLIDAIVSVLEPSIKVAVEIGGGNGSADLPLTCERLYRDGWQVQAYEADSKSRKQLAATHPTLQTFGRYEFEEVARCSVLVIDIDSRDGDAMLSATSSHWRPSLLIVEHFDMAGPYVTRTEQAFDQNVPGWLAGMQIADENPRRQFTIQARYQYLDLVAAMRKMVPILRTRVNSFYVPEDYLEALKK